MTPARPKLLTVVADRVLRTEFADGRPEIKLAWPAVVVYRYPCLPMSTC